MARTSKNNGEVGVVLCDCGGTLRKRLNFERLESHLSKLPDVATVKVCSGLCRQKECNKVLAHVSKRAKRVVIGACDRNVFDEALREASKNYKVNEGLLWCVNIREHCAWVTEKQKAATDKSIKTLATAIRRVMLASPVKSTKVRVNQDVLVLGSGPDAMQPAVALSQLGHQITLASSSEKIGGPPAETPELYCYLACDYSEAEALVRSRLDELTQQVESDKRIDVQTSTCLKSVQGESGNFSVVLESDETEQRACVGAIVLTAGPDAMESELAQLVHEGREIPKRVAIVMDILGEQGRAVSAQVLSAAELLVSRFAVEVKLYCHHIRVAATGLEALYRRAREAGLTVAKYEAPPVISEEGSHKVILLDDPIAGCQVCEEFDLVIKADRTTDNSTDILNSIEGLRAGPDCGLQYDNVWLLPTKSNREGIFVVGSIPDADELRDAQAGGLAAANQIHNLLKNKQIEVLDDAAVVDEDKCVLCLTCMRICPHGAISIDVENKAASVSSVTCQRCGICAAQCPAGAIQLPRYTDEQIKAELADVPVLTSGNKKQNGSAPKITVFACENSAYPAATAAAINGAEYDADVRLIRVPCAGKVEPRQVLDALQSGAQKVMILGCHLENCKYLTGSTRGARRMELLVANLEKAGFDSRRVVFGELASVEPSKFIQYVGAQTGADK